MDVSEHTVALSVTVCLCVRPCVCVCVRECVFVFACMRVCVAWGRESRHAWVYYCKMKKTISRRTGVHLLWPWWAVILFFIYIHHHCLRPPTPFLGVCFPHTDLSTRPLSLPSSPPPFLPPSFPPLLAPSLPPVLRFPFTLSLPRPSLYPSLISLIPSKLYLYRYWSYFLIVVFQYQWELLI